MNTIWIHLGTAMLCAVFFLPGLSAQDDAHEKPQEAQDASQLSDNKSMLEHLFREVNNELAVLNCLLSVQPVIDDPIFAGTEMNKGEYLRGFREQAAIGELPPREARKVRGKLNFLYTHTKVVDRGKAIGQVDLIARHLAIPGVIRLENGLPCEVYVSPRPEENGKALEADVFQIHHPGHVTMSSIEEKVYRQDRRPAVVKQFPELFTEIDRLLPQLPEGAAAWRVLVPTHLLGEGIVRLYSVENPQVVGFTLWKKSLPTETKIAALREFEKNDYPYEATPQPHHELTAQASYMTGCADYIDASRDTRGLWDIEEVLHQVDIRWDDAITSGSAEELLSRKRALVMRREALLDMLHELDPATYISDREMEERNKVTPIRLELK